mmetsp:Transcript_23165/g.62697  ORF Transcript_23165/g.62697 Transcript_23165/m.62697 type:complete len:290 (+) Transcript_23165:134-1003(+)|eukprot:CAMPEP_0113684874 /NCGR_PEP_ID=MMETSP0038_2-20120614/14305_1 /TAXON_ID=2898 /ORGANISM="Cryptomonas paramecium" /LENGTH=289 /DNA_ID=CAMNT_0000604791 /DNA_START=134 /DNA_END=1003 /DNA_ORIENTATION=+ /assembly_acc=CAM_ASM_000170
MNNKTSATEDIMRIESLLFQQEFSCGSIPSTISPQKQSLHELCTDSISELKLNSMKYDNFLRNLTDDIHPLKSENEGRKFQVLLLERLKLAETAVRFMQSALLDNKKQMVDQCTQTDQSEFEFDANNRIEDVASLKRKRPDEHHHEHESCVGTSGMPNESPVDESSMCSAARWTRDEHARFLQGLERFGVGQWCRISRFYLPSRTPAQIASHHQKFAQRSCVPLERRGRVSLLDMTTPAVERLLVAKVCGQAHSPYAWDHPRSAPGPFGGRMGAIGVCSPLFSGLALSS